MAKPALHFLLLLACSLFPPLSARAQSGALPDVAPVQAQHAMVVSIHHDASDAGLKMLQAGGNAVDAAVATGFALAVVHPAAGNLGGGGFMLLRKANGESHFLDFRERAPLRASSDMYLDREGKIIPEASTVGYLSVGVPGTVAGLVEAEKRFGKLSLQPGHGARHSVGGKRLCPQRGRSGHASQSPADPIPGVAAHLPAQWQFLPGGRSFPAAGTGPYAHPHRAESKKLLSWRLGQRAGQGNSEAWRPDQQEGSVALPGEGSQTSHRHLSPVRNSRPASALVRGDCFAGNAEHPGRL